jgi:uncharacterized protein YqkB
MVEIVTLTSMWNIQDSHSFFLGDGMSIPINDPTQPEAIAVNSCGIFLSRSARLIPPIAMPELIKQRAKTTAR